MKSPRCEWPTVGPEGRYWVAQLLCPRRTNRYEGGDKGAPVQDRWSDSCRGGDGLSVPAASIVIWGPTGCVAPGLNRSPIPTLCRACLARHTGALSVLGSMD